MKRSRGDNAMMTSLPDDILISIISRLSLREAAATSILSSRWRHLWTYVTRLHLPPFKPERLALIPRQERKREGEIMAERFEKYVKTIDGILDSHRGNRLEEFKLNMYSLRGARVYKWFEFALAKEVEVVEMHLDSMLNAEHGMYSLQLQSCLRYSSCLKKLSLSGIHVEDSELGLLLSNSPLLESLSIASSDRLKRVSIEGTGLKQLEICHARCLEALEIHGMMNLSSLKLVYLGYKHSFALSDVPNLVEFSSTDDFGGTIDSTLSRVAPSICAQLRTLNIIRTSMMPPFTNLEFDLEFENVKHLELEYGEHEVNESCHIRRFFDLIVACPTLEKLDIKMKWNRLGRHEEMEVNENAKISWRKYTSREVSPYLKEMNLWGFCGCAGELWLVFSILNHFKSLQQITVQACDVVSERVRQTATARAWHHIAPKLNNSTSTLQVI